MDGVTELSVWADDVPALSLAGAKKWWPRKVLEQFAITHLSLPVKTIGEIIEGIADAVMQTRLLIPHYSDDHPEFREIGARMTAIWEDGVRSLSDKTLP